MSFPRHFLRPVRCLAEGRVAPASLLLEREDFDWNGFGEFLRDHRLREFFQSLATDGAFKRVIPRPFQHRLEGADASSRRRRERLNSLEHEACAALQQRGLPVIRLKGQALEAEYYPAGIRRHQGDVDLLVRQSDVVEAVRTLRSIALQLRGNKPSIPTKQLLHQHAASLRREDLAIDLHWRFRAAPTYEIDYERIWNTRSRMTIHGMESEVLSEESLLVLLCLSLVHDLGRGGVRLKSFFDLWFVLRRAAPHGLPASFWQRCEEEGTLVPCAHALAVAGRILPQLSSVDVTSALPDEEQSRIRASRRRAFRLVKNSRGAPESFLWFAQLHQYWKPRHLLWQWRQAVPHAGRLPLALVRTAQFTWRCLQLAVR